MVINSLIKSITHHFVLSEFTQTHVLGFKYFSLHVQAQLSAHKCTLEFLNFNPNRVIIQFF
ncbi:hypothetical protein BCD66_10930 [Pseudoalteromonas tetraodonis]|nr:hypothetical protein BCD66_10930 [Pseudoalteromonas tetraodonis]